MIGRLFSSKNNCMDSTSSKKSKLALKFFKVCKENAPVAKPSKKKSAEKK